MFASIDEISAALAIPVVGVIPAFGVCPHHAPALQSVYRAAVFASQLVIAFLVFAAIAYVVKTPDFFADVWQDPIAALGRAARSFVGR